MVEKMPRAERLQPLHRQIGAMAAGERRNAGSVGVLHARKVWVTARVYYPQGADVPVFINGYYSPDGRQYDTNTLFSTFIPVTASTHKQITQCFSCVPEIGDIKFELYNSDDSQVVEAELWAGVSKWSSEATMEPGEKIERRKE